MTLVTSLGVPAAPFGPELPVSAVDWKPRGEN